MDRAFSPQFFIDLGPWATPKAGIASAIGAELTEVIAPFMEQSAILVFRPVRYTLPSLHLQPSQIGIAAAGVAAVAGIAAYVLYQRRPTAEEIERQRREYLAERGRITDATLVDIGLDRRNELRVGQDMTSEIEFAGRGGFDDSPPEVLRYQYKVGGVGYESLQDVARLEEYVRHLRVDLPIQVRYDPKNPGNSIVVAESWSGLRTGTGTGAG